MSVEVVYLPDATKDIREGYRWYKEQQPGIGRDFLAEVETTVEYLCENPRMFPLVEEDIRRALLHKYPYSIF